SVAGAAPPRPRAPRPSLHDALPICHDPGLGRVEGLVDGVGMGHDLADGAAVFAIFEILAAFVGDLRQFLGERLRVAQIGQLAVEDRKSTRLNSSHVTSSYAVFGLNK